MPRMFPHTVFITGASSGLGRGLAAHYARTGATVHAAARRTAELDKLAAEIVRRGGSGKVVPVELDVTDAEAQERAIRTAEASSTGPLDLVIANAGIAEPTIARHIDWRAVKRVLDVNVSAAAVTISAALPAMVARGSGTVVAMSSLASFRGFPGSAAYCASKAALHTFMESLRVDLRGTGVRALTVYPGFVKTEMTAKNDFPMPFLMELDPAVALMARAIDAGEEIIAFPRGLHAIALAAQLLPRTVYEALAGKARASNRAPRAP